MIVRPWQRILYRRLRSGPRPRRSPRTRGLGRQCGGGASPVLITLLVGLLLAAAVIGLLQLRLRPTVMAVAQTQTKNTMTSVVEQAIATDLANREVGYADLITIQRDASGTITALTTDMAAINLLRTELVSDVLVELQDVDVSIIQIPLGSLFNSELVWARGPTIQVRSMSVGAIDANFESEFSSAGVNQTLHRIWLELAVPMTVLLPGGRIEVPVSTRICVAETVIVGQVPETYLQLGNIPASS